MHSPSTSRSGEPHELLLEIVETLEACGLEDDSYQLQEYIDVGALEQLLASSDGDVTVQFTVDGIRLDVSPKGVDVLVKPQSGTPEE